MSISIDKTIYTLRQEKKLTQEQLATALGVSVAAVSKWENGAARPDIELIPELANFFEVSTDVLLGYDWRKYSIGETIRRMKNAKKNHQFDEGIALGEQTVPKFPNHFELQMCLAENYFAKAFATGDQKAFAESEKYYERAIDLIDQNVDPEVTRQSILKNLATACGMQGNTKKAIRMLENENSEGQNNALIARFLIQEGKVELAEEKANNAFSKDIFNLRYAVSVLTECYDASGDLVKMAEIEEMMAGIFKQMILGETGCAARRYQMLSLMNAAAQRYELEGCSKRVEDMVREAIIVAKAFDAKPDYDCSSMKFCENSKENVTDQANFTCVEYIEMMMEQGAFGENGVGMKSWLLS